MKYLPTVQKDLQAIQLESGSTAYITHPNQAEALIAASSGSSQIEINSTLANLDSLANTTIVSCLSEFFSFINYKYKNNEVFPCLCFLLLVLQIV